MENLDIIVLTTILATLFLVFFIAIYKEFSRMDKDGYAYDPNAKKYGRDVLFVFASKLFEDQTVPKEEKKVVYRAMFRTIADMESDGVHFPEDVKRELIKQREELTCEYSGLPSVKSYEKVRVND